MLTCIISLNCTALDCGFVLSAGCQLQSFVGVGHVDYFILSLDRPYIGSKWVIDLKAALTWYTLFNIVNELAYQLQYFHQSGSFYIRDYSVLISGCICLQHKKRLHSSCSSVCVCACVWVCHIAVGIQISQGWTQSAYPWNGYDVQYSPMPHLIDL